MSGRHVAGLVLGTTMAVALPLVSPPVARADCPAEGDTCLQLEAAAGAPGTRVRLLTTLGCDPGDDDAAVLFYQGEVFDIPRYPSVALDLEVAGEALAGRFLVPLLPAGEYGVTVTCPATFIEPFVASTSFTILEEPRRNASAARASAVEAGYDHTCALRLDGSVTCWGFGYVEGAQSRRGPFAAVSAGLGLTCALRTSGAIRCWGGAEPVPVPPSGSFRAVSTGQSHACAVRTDGTIACWGLDDDGQATPPSGTFADVAAGGYHTCGLRPDGTVTCWGLDQQGQAAAPGGVFKAVSAGNLHTCGIRADATLACWGAGWESPEDPPAGSFTAVSDGGWHACAIRSDGTIACWGSDDYGQATPPAGRFVSVSAGNLHTCGVRTTGTLACWGSNEHLQAGPPPDPPDTSTGGAVRTAPIIILFAAAVGLAAWPAHPRRRRAPATHLPGRP